MRTSLLATVALATLIAPAAMAADLPVRQIDRPPQPYVAYAWGGFYIGIHGGGDWFNKDWFAPSTPTNIVGVGCGAGAPTCDVSAGVHTASGWLAGGQVGFNHQVDWLVLGVEVQASWTNLEGSNASATPAGIAVGLFNHSKTNSLGTAAARLGAAWGPALLYVKGGGAWAFDRFWTTAPACNTSTCQSLKDTRWGWMVGAGVEFAFARNWSVKIEYEHLDFSRQRETLEVTCGGCLAFDYDIRQRIDLVKVGLNYSFNSSPVVYSRY
jgi:outer membrane immunogenic protein